MYIVYNTVPEDLVTEIVLIAVINWCCSYIHIVIYVIC